MHDLKQSLELGGRGLLAWLDPDRDHLPTGGYEVAHDVGRWWDAVLRLEQATGFVIPAPVEAAMLANLKRLTANPDALLVTENQWNNRRTINPHNLRETMIAYHALVRYRQDDWARQAGHRLLETIDRCCRDDGHFDATRLGLWSAIPLSDDPFIAEQEVVPGWFDSTTSTGRCLEGVVWFYEATGDELALRVADRLARHHLQMLADAHGQPRTEFFREDNVGHNHSYLGTVRGLLLFGLLTRQRAYIEAVTNIYRHSIWQRNITTSCFTTHDIGRTRFKDKHGDKTCESASTGDVAQIALWLALRDNQTDLLDDVERILRAHLLPVQVTESDLGGTRPDGRTITPKWIGGWGCLGERGWKDSTHDVLAAVVHSLCDIYRHTAVRDACGLQLNWHFDYEDDQVRILSRRDERANVRIELKQPATLRLRLPTWAPMESCRLKVNDAMQPVAPLGAYLPISDAHVVELDYALPRRLTEERSADGSIVRFEWVGDAVQGMQRV